MGRYVDISKLDEIQITGCFGRKKMIDAQENIRQIQIEIFPTKQLAYTLSNIQVKRHKVRLKNYTRVKKLRDMMAKWKE